MSPSSGIEQSAVTVRLGKHCIVRNVYSRVLVLLYLAWIMLTILKMSASRRLSQIAGQTRNASTMKEAVVGKGTKVTMQDVPIPKPGPYQVVTKVVFSGSNPKDW